MKEEFNLSERLIPQQWDEIVMEILHKSDVKEFIRLDLDLIKDLEKQLIIDFKTKLSEKSSKRFIKTRIQSMIKDRNKLAGEKLI